MGVFVYEVDGLRCAAYGDVDRSGAEAWAREEAFTRDLSRRRFNNQALWNGESAVNIADALPSEVSKWQESRDRARKAGTIDPDEEKWLPFLFSTTLVEEHGDEEIRSADPDGASKSYGQEQGV